MLCSGVSDSVFLAVSACVRLKRRRPGVRAQSPRDELPDSTNRTCATDDEMQRRGLGQGAQGRPKGHVGCVQSRTGGVWLDDRPTPAWSDGTARIYRNRIALPVSDGLFDGYLCRILRLSSENLASSPRRGQSVLAFCAPSQRLRTAAASRRNPAEPFGRCRSHPENRDRIW